MMYVHYGALLLMNDKRLAISKPSPYLFFLNNVFNLSPFKLLFPSNVYDYNRDICSLFGRY